MLKPGEIFERSRALQITDYISHTFDSRDRESEFQYLTMNSKWYYDSNSGKLERELLSFYRKNVFNYDFSRKLSERYAFLDYHLFKYVGEKIDFFDFVSVTPQLASIPGPNELIHNKNVEVYAKFLSDWCLSRSKEVERRRYPVSPADTRIMGELPAETIEDYFMGVFTIPSMKGKNKGKQIMTREEVSRFLGANFVGFPPCEIREKIKTNAQQIYLKRAVYLLYEQHRFSKHEASIYCKALHESFDDFKEYATPRTILNSFSTLPDKKTDIFLVNFLGSLLGK